MAGGFAAERPVGRRYRQTAGGAGAAYQLQARSAAKWRRSSAVSSKRMLIGPAIILRLSVFSPNTLQWSKVYNYSSSQSNVPHRYGNSHAIQDHTMLPATRQR